MKILSFRSQASSRQKTHPVKSADWCDHAAVGRHAAAADPVFVAREHLHPFTYSTWKKKMYLYQPIRQSAG